MNTSLCLSDSEQNYLKTAYSSSKRKTRWITVQKLLAHLSVKYAHLEQVVLLPFAKKVKSGEMTYHTACQKLDKLRNKHSVPAV